MRYINFIILASHSEGKGHLAFNNQFTLLEPSNSYAYIMEFLTTHSKQVFDYLVSDCLLLHNQRVLCICVEIISLLLDV